MARPATTTRLQASRALSHLYGRTIQVHDVMVDLDGDGVAVLQDKRAADALLAQEHWTQADGGEK